MGVGGEVDVLSEGEGVEEVQEVRCMLTVIIIDVKIEVTEK